MLRTKSEGLKRE